MQTRRDAASTLNLVAALGRAGRNKLPFDRESPQGKRLLDFLFNHLARQFLFGYSQIEVAPKQPAFVASPEKALLDLIYLTAGADSKKYLRQLRLQNPEALNMAAMTELAKRSNKPKLIRATRLVGPLLEEESGESL
jgi:hypothetical protein